ncbi:MAG: hypothetical protein MUE85_20670 [Microscillaceae bacterium]|jgi:hypothetical protein|nr:hypothetical protein [Microscillaceae bacterium]
MKKIIFTLTLLIGICGLNAQDRNHTEIKDLLEDLGTSVNGNYWIRLHRLTQGISQLDIQKYLATWRANRCLLRGICMAEEEDLSYNPDMNAYNLVVHLPKGKAFLYFQTDNNGYWRLTKYQTEGNINSCPVGVTPTCNFYAQIDLLGTWVFNRLAWHQKPESLRQDLSANGWDEDKIKKQLEERAQISNDPKNTNVTQITFNANGTCKIEYSNAPALESKWRLSYNQLQIITQNADYEPFNWRIDPEGNFNLIEPEAEYDGTYKTGEIKMIFWRKKNP